MYSRNSISKISYTDSTDGGITWGTYQTDNNLSYTGNCMISFINIEGIITDTKTNQEYTNLIVASYPKTSVRKDGVIRIGSMDKDGKVTWLNTDDVRYNGYYGYSNITQLSNEKTLALSYEDSLGSIKYTTLIIDDLLPTNYKFNYIVNPNTYDDIGTYIALMLFSITGLIYIYIKKSIY